MTVVRSVSFTAARDMDEAARQGIVTSVLTVHVPHAVRYVTGGCIGGDAFIGRWLYVNRPQAEHVVIVPANRSRVDPWWLEAHGRPVTVLEMPPGTTYADRNARLVTEAGAVIAFPARPEDDPRSRRSGTWQTVRMSRRVGNFSQWHLVTPPYRGCIEEYAGRLLGVVTHARLPDGTGVTPCCGKTPFELPRGDKFGTGHFVTCGDGG